MGSIKRGKYKTNYFHMYNEAVRDPELTAQAKGVLAYLLSMPPDWQIYTRYLYREFNNGRDAIIKAFNELVEATYIIKTEIRDESGRKKGYDYDVYPLRYKRAIEMDLIDEDDVIQPKPDNKEPEPKAAAPEEKPVEPKEAEKEKIPFKAIIDYLNEKTGKTYKNVPGNQKLIRTIWNQGYSFEDFKTVIDNQVADWTGVIFTKSGKPGETYLKPATLFGPKFDEYLNNTPKQPQQKKQLFAEPKQKKDVSSIAEINGQFYDLKIPEQKAIYMELLAAQMGVKNA